MADEWYELATEDHFWMRWRHREILRAVERAKVPIQRALEIGCGKAVARQMLERDLGVPVDGCDLNRAGLEMAKPGLGRLFFYDIFDQDPAMLGRYDAVFLLDVLEHIEDDTAFLAAAIRHLRVGGIVIVNVPASMLLFSQYDIVAGHVRRYRHGNLTRVFEQSGLAPESVRYWGMLMLPVALARKVRLTFTSKEETIRAGFEPPNQFARRVLGGMMNLETSLPSPVPFGTSLLAWGRRQPTSNG